MKKIVWIIRIELLTPTGTQPLQAIKVFESADDANRYQNSINNDPIYQNIKAFCFCEPAIWVESSE